MKDGFIKVATGTPTLKVADCAFNAQQMILLAKNASQNDVKLLVTPELGLTGYTCGDLFLQETLLQGAINALQEVCDGTKNLGLLLLVGLPIRFGGKLYNCAAFCYNGAVLGLVPKTHLPAFGAYTENRTFAPGFEDVKFYTNSFLHQIPLSTKLLFTSLELPEFTIGVELGKDLWVPAPPSVAHALAGASVIANLSACNETVGSAEYREILVNGQSARLVCAYLYANAGLSESTTDLVFAGHNLIAENGALLSETLPFEEGTAIAEIDVMRLHHERRRLNTYPALNSEGYHTVQFSMPLQKTRLTRSFSPLPFVPANGADIDIQCETILNIQAAGLAKRIQHTGAKTLVLGVSGGLDSCLAMLVALRAFARLNRPASDILAVTMPAFGTTPRTRSNAEKLSTAIGATFRTIDITQTVLSHFEDIEQDKNEQDVVYENAQARMRTLVLMDLANKTGGMVIGTGDLSELALGWATYNGDHMSMYGVNASIPKTLLRLLVAHEGTRKPNLNTILQDILDTPVSPELLPAQNGEISQKTEDIVGPYELHDFTLYYALRWGCSPSKILRLATIAFAGKHDHSTIVKWLTVFYRRFFSQQFKRSCLPDGPKVGSVCLSPRGDWQMPSDASSALWRQEIEQLAAR